MRVLFTTYPGPSHYFPVVPLAWALRAAGHEVVVATLPSFADSVAATGLSAVPVGGDVDPAAMFRAGFGDKLKHTARLPAAWPASLDELRATGMLPGMLAGLGHFVDVAGLMAEDAIAFARWWRPELVVHEPTAFLGPVVAAALGIPAVRHLWGPDFFHWIDELGEEALAPLGERFGLEKIAAGGDLVVDPAPPAVQVVNGTPRQLVRCVPYNGAGRIPAWLSAETERPRVCVTWGTWIRDNRLRALFRVPDVLEALADQEVEVVVTATAAERELLPTVPGNVWLVDPIPLHLLLPTCAAIVHQGGTGTTMTALTHGVPQLAVPQIPDQIFNSGRMAGAGAGGYVPVADATVDTIRTAFEPLLGERTQAAAADLRQQIAGQPALPEVVDVLVTLAAEGPIG